MANPPRQKGTAGETELVRLLAAFQIDVVRAPASSKVDLRRKGGWPLSVLATRPDRGRWLLTMDLEDFATLVTVSDIREMSFGNQPRGLDIEVKRYARFALHAIYEEKFPRRSR